jgi:adenylate cyclase
LLRPHEHVVVTIAVMVTLAVALLRWWGHLEPLELAAYDRILREAAESPSPPSPITLIQIHEADIRRHGHPIPDNVLTRTLERLLGAEPRAIGVDVYRPVPVPAPAGSDPPGSAAIDGYARLGELVSGDDRVVMVMKFPGANGVGTPPPSFLANETQVGFSDLPLDPGRVVRRGLLFMSDGERTWTSFALQLALRHLNADGILEGADPDQPEHLRLGHATIPPFASSDGPYAHADDRGYQFLLDFREGRGTFPAFSLTELLSGSVGDEMIRDRVVILGTTAPSVKDIHDTPIGDLYGIEVHAQAVGQLMRMARTGAAPLSSLPDWGETLWILIWSLLGAELGIRSRALWVTLGFTMAGFAALIVLGTSLLGAMWFLPVVPPALAGLASAGFSTSFVAVRERRERAQVTRLFSRFLRPTVADEIWRQRELFMAEHERGRPPSRSIVVTTLISDLKGYTEAGEAMTPEALMGWINEYMDVMADLIERNGGVVDDYAGDGIKANFGFPVPSESESEIDRDAVNAVRCGLAMGDAIERLNRDWKARGVRTGQVRIGILTGPVVAGVLGSQKSLKYTTVGDAVNTASRLESFDKDGFSADDEGGACRILIGEETRRRIGSDFRTTDLGKHLLPGKHQEIRIHQVLGTAISIALAVLLGSLVAAAPASADDDPQAAQLEGVPERVPRATEDSSAKPKQTQPRLESDVSPRPRHGAAETRRIRFIPRTDIGAPSELEGGATRSASLGPRIRAVVPQGFGLTLESQPVLSWHLSKETSQKATFRLMSPDGAKALVDEPLDGPLAAGLQRIRLADYGVELEPGLIYGWGVQIGSRGQVAEARIQRLDPAASLRRNLREAKAADRPILLAESGIWYDALEGFSLRIDAAPEDATRRAERRALIESAELDPSLAE